MKSTSSKIIAAFCAGALAGAAVGILLAPDKGSETRKKIKNKVKDISEKGKNLYKKYRHEECDDDLQDKDDE